MASSDSLVSILIPAYNAEKWLADTLRSALAQTWERKEIIVVDDGSTDHTERVARQFPVTVVTQTNSGAAAARNHALSLSSGDYIQWLDADDLLEPNKIAAQMAEKVPPKTLLSSSFGSFLYRTSKAVFNPTALWSNLSPVEFMLLKMERRIFMQPAVWLVSRELSNATGPWNETLSFDDDGEYFSRVLLACDGIRFSPQAKMFYRVVGSNSLSYLGSSEEKLDSMWRSMQLQMRYLRSVDDGERARSACITYLQNYLPEFHPTRPDIVEQFHTVAAELGGKLNSPQLSWKYSWIKRLFGWNAAKRIRQIAPNAKWSLVRRWDAALFALERQ